MYEVKFYPDFGECGGDEVSEIIDMFNSKYDILLNKSVSEVYEEEELCFSCKTEDRLLWRLLSEIAKNFDLNRLSVEHVKGD